MQPAPDGYARRGAPPERSVVDDLASAEARVLVHGLTDRDRATGEALATLFRSYAPAAIALAQRVTRQGQLAEDAVQEAFLALWAAPDRYDPAKGTVRAFLLATVHHKAVDAVRQEEARHRREHERAGQQRSASDVAMAITDLAERVARRTAMSTALTALPPTQRQVVQLMYFDGKTQEAIAEELAIPLGTVKSRALAAMRKLRTVLAAGN